MTHISLLNSAKHMFLNAQPSFLYTPVKGKRSGRGMANLYENLQKNLIRNSTCQN